MQSEFKHFWCTSQKVINIQLHTLDGLRLVIKRPFRFRFVAYIFIWIKILNWNQNWKSVLGSFGICLNIHIVGCICSDRLSMLCYIWIQFDSFVIEKKVFLCFETTSKEKIRIHSQPNGWMQRSSFWCRLLCTWHSNGHMLPCINGTFTICGHLIQNNISLRS